MKSDWKELKIARDLTAATFFFTVNTFSFSTAEASSIQNFEVDLGAGDFTSLQTQLNEAEFLMIRHHLDSLQEEQKTTRSEQRVRRRKRKTSFSIPKNLSEVESILTNLMPEKPFAAQFASHAREHFEHSELSMRELAVRPKVMNVPSSTSTPLTLQVNVDSGVQFESAGNQVQAQVQVQALATSENRSNLPYFEAFDETIAVSDVQSTMVSNEAGATQKGKRGWQVSRTSDHWPTLSWLNQKSEVQSGVPLLSTNSIQILGSLAGILVDDQKGIVFGKIAPGWEVDFTGIAEGAGKVVILDSQLQLVSSTDTQTQRYFAFLNVDSGAQFIYFHSPSLNKSGAVGVPILAGNATYLDLTDITMRPLSGRVFQEGDEDDRGNSPTLAGTTVRVLGQPSVAGSTDLQGNFKFEGVVTALNYPIFVETDRGAGFTHRYQVIPEVMENIFFYRIPVRIVREWLEQLEGGIDNQSGLVVAAMPQLVDKFEHLDLLPNIRTLMTSKELFPETYTLSPAGELKVHQPLHPYGSRFIGVQIPEGLNIAELIDHSENSFWSELLMSSPGVINMIGPY